MKYVEMLTSKDRETRKLAADTLSEDWDPQYYELKKFLEKSVADFPRRGWNLHNHWLSPTDPDLIRKNQKHVKDIIEIINPDNNIFSIERGITKRYVEVSRIVGCETYGVATLDNRAILNTSF